MTALQLNRPSCAHRRQHLLFPLLSLFLLLVAVPASALPSREPLEGVENFGKVTDRYFRGGKVTPAGVERLAEMGVRTIVDLRDKESPGEAETCARHGIRYYKFPMDGHVTPDDKMIHRVLSIIEQAKEPVYVHCSAGKHRAGTIAALYRMRVQGWSKEKAWAEQQSYGFGPAEEHPELYAYVYGKSSAGAGRRVVEVASRTARGDDDDDEKEKSKSKKKEKAFKSKKDDDDDDEKDKAKDKKGDVDQEKKSSKSKSASGKVKKQENDVVAEVEDKPSRNRTDEEAEPTKKSTSSENPAGLSADADYISVAEAVKLAKASGGNGEILKIDLEWDTARSVTTWDVTFSSGTEYEIDALSGELLGKKSKAPAKLAALSPLAMDSRSTKGGLSFQDIIRKAEAQHGQTVIEMEMKSIKGRPGTLFEVVLADGKTLFYDAATGGETNAGS